MKQLNMASNGEFKLKNPSKVQGLYFPLASEKGLKSAIAPDLNGDAKLDQNHFLFEPASIENLNNNRSSRNFWIKVDGRVMSATGVSAMQQANRFSDKEDETEIQAGYMWQEVTRINSELEVKTIVTSFVPYDKNCEIHIFKVENMKASAVELNAVAAFPIYGRSADNLRDHRHVTSLLHRIETTENGIRVNPTLSFDERGHQLNDTSYYVYGFEVDGKAIEGTYPVLDDFIGAGTLDWPEAVLNDFEPVKEGTKICGQEAIGAIKFAKTVLDVNESITYVVIAGIGQEEKYSSLTEVVNDFEATKDYWNEKVNVSYQTGNADFDSFMSWVSFQPELRRLFGCSFLPHHDYGRGGRGWRDLWQDCLALLIMNPSDVRKMLVANFGGVRADGTNATIIGSNLGEFKADRNGIARVWMDHGVWPFITVMLYLNQTGDFSMLDELSPYFEEEYKGSCLEHLILENLWGFYEVGEHNHSRIRGADWNDALDMANDRGESVAFTNAYGKNLIDLSKLIQKLKENGKSTITVFKELSILLIDDANMYDSVEKKLAVLDEYQKAISKGISGQTVELSIDELAEGLYNKGQWILDHVRKTEWIELGESGFFNGYYDNDGNPLEGVRDGKVDMMLTSQVFSIMSGTASDEQIVKITKAADEHLFDEKCGGYRLNTNFNEIKTNMGRMFGFAFGEKENGAVFSHMAVMYANALYQRGFAKEGFKSLNALFEQSVNYEVSKIYPGIPEYFGRGGRGLYHYLTGAASWYMLTVITEMFGVKGNFGELSFEPKLLACQFDENKKVALSMEFNGRPIKVTYINEKCLEYGQYKVGNVECLDDSYKVYLVEA